MNNQNAQKPLQAEPPDKNLFKTMMGVFFLIFAMAPAYWAFYNYGEYTRTTAFVGELREKPQQFLTPNELEERKHLIAFNGSMANRYRLEMMLSSAGSLVLFVVALLFFRSAFKGRNRKNYYQDIDWRGRQMPTARLEVRYTSLQTILLIGLISFFGLLFSFNLYQTLTSPFSSSRSIAVQGGLSLFVLGLILFLVFLTITSKRKAAKLFDESGVTRGDGRRFHWAEFQGVVMQTARNRYGKTYLWRCELAFSGSETAWIIPNRVKNFGEVSAYLSQLPSAVLKEIK